MCVCAFLKREKEKEKDERERKRDGGDLANVFYFTMY